MNQTTATTAGTARNNSLIPRGAQYARLRRWRAIKDSMAKYGVGAGGIGVVIALGLIFVYLFSEVFPLFQGASVDRADDYTVTAAEVEGTRYLAMERYGVISVRFEQEGRIRFFNTANGQLRGDFTIPLPEDVTTTSFARGESRSRLVAYGLSDGTAVIVRHESIITYPDDQRHIEPTVTYPLAAEPVLIDDQGAAITALAVQEGASGITVAAATEDGRLLLAVYSSTVSFMTGEKELTLNSYAIPRLPDGRPRFMLVNSTSRNLFVADDQGHLAYYDISNPQMARLADSKRVVAPDATISSLVLLNGTVSLIVGGSDGSVVQWFLVRDDDNNYHITRVREFTSHDGPVLEIAPEYTRKGFLTGGADGRLGVHYPTSASTVMMKKISDTPVSAIALSPINNALLLQSADGKLQRFDFRNHHPDVSFSALWKKVWYEGRADPEYIWQASSGTDEFEPKFSLVPLSIGTLKAALFAMLFAMPLAIMGAIYSAYFMSPKIRGYVKPTIEVMEALPTVILGFLAGLWLAPFIETNIPAVFGILILMPLGMLLFGLVWSTSSLRRLTPPGWEAVLLIPVVVLIGWFCVAASPLVEIWFFNGSMRQWFTDIGITYDQRNALVVGIAMGFAVIPTIYSIAEDAVFNVPKHLTQGSLALGATPWQTVVGVVLPTASPGIFSAVMIGFGRAVGETMIVLMATGNSPVVNFNIFEGMRTLSANIAVELPETAVASSHYRVLFLAALVLLALTFVVNTIAEIVRQRLRVRYSSL
jgi:phosphate transport system permease protein